MFAVNPLTFTRRDIINRGSRHGGPLPRYSFEPRETVSFDDLTGGVAKARLLECGGIAE